MLSNREFVRPAGGFGPCNGSAIRDKQERVIAAVKVQGVAAPQIRTSGYRVNPEYAEPERGKAPRVTGYRATNTIQVEVRSIENIGKVIDAALGAGATNIGPWGCMPPTRMRRAVRRCSGRSRRRVARPSRRRPRLVGR